MHYKNATDEVVLLNADKSHICDYQALQANCRINGKQIPVYGHRAKRIQSFLNIHKDRLTLVFLPPYSLHLNADERV